MRHILTTALFIALPFTASAGCGDYPNWIDAQRAYLKGQIALDGTGQGEPDGLACEGNPGYPGEIKARDMIMQGLPESPLEGPTSLPLNTWHTEGQGVAPLVRNPG